MLEVSKQHHEMQKVRFATENIDSTLGFAFISDAIDHELRVFWDFTWRDWSTSLISGTMCTIAALRSLEAVPSSTVITKSLIRSLIYFFLYIYTFTIANQINGVNEDRINKPDRPLCSGRVSLQGAYIRWYVTTTAYLVVGAVWGVLPWTALWVFISIYTCFYGGDKHWTTKNLLFISVGTLCQLRAAWGLVAPIDSCQRQWALLLSVLFGIVINVQDMRDVEGDKIARRRTLPVVLGSNFRWIMAAVICAAPVICWKAQFFNQSHWLVGYCGAVLTLAMFYLACRVFWGGSKEYDHKTYMILTYIYCGCIAVPMLFP